MADEIPDRTRAAEYHGDSSADQPLCSSIRSYPGRQVFLLARSARTSASNEFGKVSWRDPNCVRDADMHELTRGAELVDCSRADAEMLSYLARRQEPLGQLHVARGHRGDKSSLVRRGTDSIRCI